VGFYHVKAPVTSLEKENGTELLVLFHREPRPRCGMVHEHGAADLSQGRARCRRRAGPEPPRSPPPIHTLRSLRKPSISPVKTPSPPSSRATTRSAISNTPPASHHRDPCRMEAFVDASIRQSANGSGGSRGPTGRTRIQRGWHGPCSSSKVSP